MSVTLYGIPNCDTVKKARVWLSDRGVDYHFHNYKTDGIDEARLKAWCAALGWEKVLNKAGTTFRALPPEDKVDLNEAAAIALMLAHPSLIKRPLLDVDGQFTAGFKPEIYEAVFG